MERKIKSHFLRAIIQTVKKINSWLEQCRIRVYAAQASFFITISALPFLIMILTLGGYFMPLGGGVLKDAILSIIPNDFSDAAEALINEVADKSNIKLLSVSAITLFWSASRGIRGIGAGIRNVYCGKREGGFIRYGFKAIRYTLLWMLTVVMTLVIWVFGDTIISHTGVNGAYNFMKVLNSGAFLVVLTAVFALTYRGYSGKKVKFFSQLRGAAFSALGWFLYSRFFEFYIENFADYSYIYGSLTSLIIVMLWLYSCMEILLIGAGINAFWDERVKKG